MNKEEKRKYVFAQLNSLPNAFQYVEVTNYIKSLEQQNQQLHNKIEKAIKIMEDYTLFSLSAEKAMKVINVLKDSDIDE